MLINAPKIATSGDEYLSDLHHLSDLGGFNIDETVLIRDAKK